MISIQNEEFHVSLRFEVSAKTWALREPFAISRAVHTDIPTMQVRVTDTRGLVGFGEGHGVTYEGETVAGMMAQIEDARPVLEHGVTRQTLVDILPAGGARFALDSALWDLECKATGVDPFTLAGVDLGPVRSARTIGIRALADYERAARAVANWAVLKIKVDGREPLAAVEAVRRGSPRADLIVDPNQAWSVDQLKDLAPRMAELGVVLLEQPIPIGAEAGLDGYRAPVPLCADELVDEEADLAKAIGRFAFVNIKLDKCGGLTTALRLADAATRAGLGLMVGCMGGSSLNMAPAMVLARRCAFVDLDGPMFLTEDCPNGYDYLDGVVAAPYKPELWG